MFALPSFGDALLLARTTDALVQIEGATTCPTRDDVAQQLERLLPARPADIEPDRASIHSEDGAIRLTLVRPDGTPIGEKRLELKASCAEMAEAVALVIAIWERPIRPGLVPPLDVSLSARPEAGTALIGTATAAKELSVRAPEETDEHTAESNPPAVPAATWRFEVGAAMQSLGPLRVPGALVEGVFRHLAGGWGFRAAVGGSWWNDTAVGPGSVSWTRVGGGVGLIHGWAGPRLFLDLREQFLAAALVARGHGYDETVTRVVFDPGLEVGIRPGVLLAPWLRLWIDVGLAFWPVPRELQVSGFEQTVDASRWVGALSFGGSFLSTR